MRLPTGPYDVLYADPPWHFKVWKEPADHERSRHARRHYSLMSMDALKALPVRDIAAPDAALFLWVIDSMLPEALALIEAWGFEYKTTAFTWLKLLRRHRVSAPLFMTDRDFHMGMGHWSRANPERVLLATRGRPKRVDRGVRHLQFGALREHSRKPDCVRDAIVRLMGEDTRRLEMFARARHDGWDAWGNEPDKFTAEGNGND